MNRTLSILARLALCAFLVLGPVGCRALSAASELADNYAELRPKIDQIVENGSAVLSQTNEITGEVKDLHSASLAEADKDGDGKLSLTEIATYLALMGVGGTELARRKLAQKQSIKNGIIHERINGVASGNPPAAS